jgi:hypothetical protein
MVGSLDTLSVYLFDAPLLMGAFAYWVYSRDYAGQPTIACFVGSRRKKRGSGDNLNARKLLFTARDSL